MIGFNSKLSGASGRAMAAYVSPKARSASMFSDNPPNTLNGSLNTLFAAMLVKLVGGRGGSGPVAFVHVIRQTQAGMSRCRIFFESLNFAKPPSKRFGRERSANKSTRRRVKAGNIHFVKVNGLPLHESPQAKSLAISQGWAARKIRVRDHFQRMTIGFAATYRNIRMYKCRSAGARRYRRCMWKNVRNATLGTATMVVWFAVVTLGFGAQLWPLLEGVR